LANDQKHEDRQERFDELFAITGALLV